MADDFRRGATALRDRSNRKRFDLKDKERMNSRRRATSLVALIAASAALVLWSPIAASAHDGLIGSNPADGEKITTELTSVELTFTDNFLTIGGSTAPFAVQVKGPDAKFYNLGCVELEDTTIRTSVALGESGAYEVLWQVVSADGHTTSDSFTFSYERPSEAVPSKGAATGVTCDPLTGEAVASTPATPAPAPAASAADSFGRALPWVVVGIGVAALGFVGFLLQVQIARQRSKL